MSKDSSYQQSAVSVKFGKTGKVKSVKVKKTDYDESCECAEGVADSIRKSIEKHLGKKKFKNAAVVSITLPVVI